MGKSWLSEYGLLSGGWETPLRADIRRAYEVAEGNEFQRAMSCVASPGVHALAAFRFGQWALQQPHWARVLLDPVYWILNFGVKAVWGIDISRYAQIGAGLHIAHPGALTIEPSASIGRYCNLSNSITIGALTASTDLGPTLGDDVSVGPGARILGAVRIGNNVRIGANAVVTSDLPDNAVVEVEPGCRITGYRGSRDQVGLPAVQKPVESTGQP